MVMRAIIYRESGPSDVLQVVDRPIPEPGPGEVRVRMRVSAVNPTDWKARAGGPVAFPEQVPNQDGAGVIDAVGEGVDPARVGQRVWILVAAYQRPSGTAQEYAVLPADRVVPLADAASFDLGADLGVPFLTAHRSLTVNEGGPRQLEPGALDGRSVLVAGGAGAVGNAAIQLARWAGATVLTTVSGAEKAALATAAGAQHVINYRSQDVVDEVRRIAPEASTPSSRCHRPTPRSTPRCWRCTARWPCTPVPRATRSACRCVRSWHSTRAGSTCCSTRCPGPRSTTRSPG